MINAEIALNGHFGVEDLEGFPLEFRNSVTGEQLLMDEENGVLIIRRVPNGVKECQLLTDYLGSLSTLPSISIGKWVVFQFLAFNAKKLSETRRMQINN